MIPGQPPEGATPSGVTTEHASFAPSDAAIVSCSGVAANADPLATSAVTSAARAITRRPTTGDRVSLFYDPRHGHAADRRLRLGGRRSHGPARVPRQPATRRSRVPRRQRAPALPTAAAR